MLPFAEPAPQASPSKELAKRAAAAALALLALCLLLLAARAASGAPWEVLAAQAAAAGALAAGVASLGSGVAHVARRRPELRRPLAFVAVLTLVILGAHLYIIDSPATFTSGSPLSGLVGSQFSDTQLSVSSRLAGGFLQVNVTNIGSNAVSAVTVKLGRSALPESGFASPATTGDPLQPQGAVALGFRDSIRGYWAAAPSMGANLTVSYTYNTCYHVPTQSDPRGVYGCIMDETYYVPSAQALLAGTQCSPFVSNCNMEHPFLAKAIMAAGMAVFGVTGFGWRVFEAVMGSLSVALAFALVFMLSGGKRVAYLAAILMSLDTMFFVHSSAGLIDIPSVFFALLGFVFYFWKARYWIFDNLLASGVFFGLSALCKETSVFLLGAVLTYELLFGRQGLARSIWRSAMVALPAVLVFVAGVQCYDWLFAAGTYPYFYQHIGYMLSYGAGLKGGGWTDNVLGTYITPLNWLTFYSPVSYLVTTVQVTSGSTSYHYIGVGYYGVGNVIVTWMVFVWLPLAVYTAVKGRRAPDALDSPGDWRLAGLLTSWFSWAYLPYVLLWLYGRVTYPFYIIPAVPALAGGAAFFTTRGWFSKKLALVYVAFAFFLFFLYFPVKDFLPTYLRVLLGR